MTRPHQSRAPAPPKDVDINVLSAIRRVIANIKKPTWVGGLPKNFGSKAAGTPKADEWRVLFTVYLPIALIMLWGKHSVRTPEEDRLRRVLRHTMYLVTAIRIACRRTMTSDLADAYLNNYTQYIKELADLFPGVGAVPNMHVAFHVYDFLLLFGPVRSWWTFPFERLVGLFQKLISNHHFG
jgi:hypothetical protein